MRMCASDKLVIGELGSIVTLHFPAKGYYHSSDRLFCLEYARETKILVLSGRLWELSTTRMSQHLTGQA